MASYFPVVKNNAGGAIFYVSLAPRTATGTWQSNPTLAVGDVKISLDGGALANLTTLPEVAPAASKLVKVTLSQPETNADNIVVIFSDAAGAEWADLTVNLQTTSKQFNDLATQASVDTIDDFVDTEVAAILAAVDTEVAAIKAKTDNLPAAPAATGDAMTLTTGERTSVANAVWAATIETGLTALNALRGAAAALFGKASGADTATETFRNALADSKDRLVFTVDAAGNRSSVVTDFT